MRVDVEERSLAVAGGAPVRVDVDVFNTTNVIDGVTASVVGLDPDWIRSSPSQLALFPETTGRMTVELAVPPSFPAGRHVVTLAMSSSVSPDETGYVDLELDVASRAEASVTVLPAARTARRRASFTVRCDNEGNEPLELALHATDAARVLRHRIEPPVVAIEPGGTAMATLHVRGRRHLFGNVRTQAIDVFATGEDVDSIESGAVFHQRPMVARGVLTALVLLLIIGAWAGAFLLGLSKVLARDPLTKSAPASFFAASSALAAANGDPNAPPVGAVSKTGGAAGVVGSVSGKVTAATTKAGIGRITVEAIRETRDGPRLVSSAATQADGSYTLEGLFPATYKLHFSAHGFQDEWFPTAPDASSARPVQVPAGGEQKGVDVEIQGLPGSLSGRVDTGDATAVVPVNVTVQSTLNDGTAAPAAQAVTDATGAFTVPNLPAPASYQLTFSAPGYQPSTTFEQINGGEARIGNTVRLSAGAGTISGLVTDGTNPLGGVMVATSVSGKPVVSATPTAGTVGRFTLTGLPTPGTYLVTLSKDGFGAQTVAVALAPGQSRDDTVVALVGGTGTVSGKVVDDTGKGLGDVTVTVGGGPSAASTKTLTAGAVGTFVLSGLPTPGSYTLTFTLDGFGSQTVGVALSSNSFARDVAVTLAHSVARLHGIVRTATPDATPLAGVDVTITDGVTERKSVTTSLPPGGYTLTNLAPGTYSVTFSIAGFLQQTALVTVTAGQDATQDIALTAVTP